MFISPLWHVLSGGKDKVPGEPEFWLKITDSTSNWVNAGGSNPSPPSTEKTIRVHIGFTSDFQVPFNQGTASRPSHSRSDLIPVPTIIHTDLRHSTLQANPHPDSRLSLNIQIFDSSTTGVENSSDYTSIQPGQEPDAEVRVFCLDLAVGQAAVAIPSLSNKSLLAFIVILCSTALLLLGRKETLS